MRLKNNRGELANSSSLECLVGVDVGGTKTAVVLSTNPPQVMWRRAFPTEPLRGPQHAIEKIIALIREGISECGATPSRIGVSCGGPLDRMRGIIQSPPNLPTWDHVPLKAMLEEAIGCPCLVENDANAGAIAEHRFGAGRGTQNMIFLTLGTGLGAGLILKGHIFRGASEMAGEIGHVRLSSSGPVGHGKAGSVEGWASGGGMAQHGAVTIRTAIANGEATCLADKVDALTARDIGEALAQGDIVAKRIVENTGERLGEALAVLVDVLNPERIVVGGLALRFGEHLLGPARRRLEQEALQASVDACIVVPAALGEQIGDIAALCTAMNVKPNQNESLLPAGPAMD